VTTIYKDEEEILMCKPLPAHTTRKNIFRKIELQMVGKRP
jgi:hypothetical protein